MTWAGGGCAPSGGRAARAPPAGAPGPAGGRTGEGRPPWREDDGGGPMWSPQEAGVHQICYLLAEFQKPGTNQGQVMPRNSACRMLEGRDGIPWRRADAAWPYPSL